MDVLPEVTLELSEDKRPVAHGENRLRTDYVVNFVNMVPSRTYWRRDFFRE